MVDKFQVRYTPDGDDLQSHYWASGDIEDLKPYTAISKKGFESTKEAQEWINRQAAPHRRHQWSIEPEGTT